MDLTTGSYAGFHGGQPVTVEPDSRGHTRIMSTFAANTADMRTRSLAVQSTIDRLRTDVNALQAGLQDLSSTWQGAASSNFQSVIADWRATQSRVEESLSGIGTALSRASEFYDQAEQANAAMFTY